MAAAPNMTKTLSVYKTLVIGAGGSGIKSALLLKKYLSTFFDLEYTNLFKFILVDCEDPTNIINEIDKSLRDINEENRIATSIDSDLLNNKYLRERLEPHFYNFHETGARVDDTNDGAGTTRIYSTISLYKNAENIYDKVRSAFQDLREKGSTDTDYRLTEYASSNGFEVSIHGQDLPQVFIFSSTTGGTGAGTFLDIAAITRAATNIEGSLPKIFGFLYLPDVFLNPISDKFIQKLSSEQKRLIQANAYASLKELDYFLHGNSFTCQYSDSLSVHIENIGKNKIFNKVFLFDKFINSEYMPLQNSWDVFKMVAEGALHLTCSEIGANLNARLIDNRIWDEKYPDIHEVGSEWEDNGQRNKLYSSFGVYTLEVPKYEIETWFKQKSVEDFLSKGLTSGLAHSEVVNEVKKETMGDRDDLLGKMGVPYQKEKESRDKSRIVNEKRLFTLLRNKVMENINRSYKSLANADSVEKVSAFVNWEVDISGNLFDQNLMEANKFLKKLVEDFKHDFHSSAEKKLNLIKDKGDLDTSYNYSLEELILNITNRLKTKTAFDDIETVLEIMRVELRDIESFVSKKRSEISTMPVRPIGNSVTRLLNEIERKSNFLSFIDPSLGIDFIDAFKEKIDLKKGVYNRELNQITQLVDKNFSQKIDNMVLDALEEIIDFVQREIETMLTEPDSIWRRMLAKRKTLLKELNRELAISEARLIKSREDTHPLTKRYAPTRNDLESLFEQGFLNLSYNRILNYLKQRNISLADILTRDSLNLSGLIKELDSILDEEFHRFESVLSFDNDEFFDKYEIQSLQKDLVEKSKAGIKFKESYSDYNTFQFYVTPTEKDVWQLSGFKSYGGPNPDKYTVFQLIDGIPSSIIYNINEWHDTYSDLMRTRTFPDKAGGNMSVRPLHVFNFIIEQEPFIDEEYVWLLRTPNVLDIFIDHIFRESLEYDVISRHGDKFIYRGVIDFGPASEEEFKDKMRKNLSFLWDLREAVYDKQKITDRVSAVTAKTNREYLNKAREEARLKQDIQKDIKKSDDPDLLDAWNKLKE